MRKNNLQQIVLVLDCGATNVRCIAVNEKGELIASHSITNQTKADPFFQHGLIWDVEDIWQKLIKCTHEVSHKIDSDLIAGITVSTFGVDCSLLCKNGELLYPVISWACQRTQPIMDNIDKYIALENLYKQNGVNKNGFNTINKLIWFKENKSEILHQADYFLFISSIFLQKLSGEFVTESTMAGTSMLTDCISREFSSSIFTAIGIENKFPKLVEAGEIIGKLAEKASKELGLPKGIPVIAAGHDTQFAIFGSGARINELVLSSGTWEILMARTQTTCTNFNALTNDITNEFDAQKGLYNSGVQWLGSGVLEWLINILYSKEKQDLNSSDFYNMIINDAENIKYSNVKFNPDFRNSLGAILGLSIDIKREEIYRAALSALAEKTAKKLKLLEENLGFKAESVIVVGGGSKNKLWNQLRAKEIKLPVKLIDKKETTVLGAALYAFAGIGTYASANEAREQVKYKTEIIN